MNNEKEMSLKELEHKLYILNMRKRSIEAEMTRVPPFSEEFDSLANSALDIVGTIDRLLPLICNQRYAEAQETWGKW